MSELSGRTRADDIADVVREVSGVADLHPGTFGEVATYLPGRRVVGVRLRDDVTEVHVALKFGASVLNTAEAIRLAVQPLVGTAVNIAVEDVIDQ